MPKRIADFDEKVRFIVETIQKKGGRIDYKSLFNHVKRLDVWRTNPSEAIASALAGMATEKMVVFLDKNGKDITEKILKLPDDRKRKAIRTENVVVQLNLENKSVEEIIKKFGVFGLPEYINEENYDFIASADVLASRFGSIAVMWKKAIIVEVTGYRVWMCIRGNSKRELKFFYMLDGEPVPISRLADLVEKNLRSIELSSGKFEDVLLSKDAKIHFYSEIPYNSGFIMSSAIAALLAVGIKYLEDSYYFKEAVNASRCIASDDYDKIFNRREIVKDAIAIADNLYMRDKSPIPSTTSTSAEYLLLFGSSKPATVFCYKNKSESYERLQPEVYPYYFDKPLFTDIWTGPGHDFLGILRSIKRRSERLPNAKQFFEKIAEDLYASVWNYGKAGLDLIQKGLAKGESEEVARGFDLLKVAIYEQICNSLRFTFEYFSYPHIANLTQILGQYGKYGSPVGVGGGGFFQLLNENFREDREFAKLLLEVCRDWCLYHGGRIVKNLPYILPKRENRFFWGIIVHKSV